MDRIKEYLAERKIRRTFNRAGIGHRLSESRNVVCLEPSVPREEVDELSSGRF